MMKKVTETPESHQQSLYDHPWTPHGKAPAFTGSDVTFDMRTIIDVAAQTGTIIELNASPYRLDIDWRHMKYAKGKGVTISINPDAHAAAGFTEIFYGVGVARKGSQEKKDILNTQDVNGIKET